MIQLQRGQNTDTKPIILASETQLSPNPCGEESMAASLTAVNNGAELMTLTEVAYDCDVF